MKWEKITEECRFEWVNQVCFLAARIQSIFDWYVFVFDFTFINTDSLNFSRLIILIATFLPRTQCTPSFTRPVDAWKTNKRANKQKTVNQKRLQLKLDKIIIENIMKWEESSKWATYLFDLCQAFYRGDTVQHIDGFPPVPCSLSAFWRRRRRPRAPRFLRRRRDRARRFRVCSVSAGQGQFLLLLLFARVFQLISAHTIIGSWHRRLCFDSTLPTSYRSVTCILHCFNGTLRLFQLIVGETPTTSPLNAVHYWTFSISRDCFVLKYTKKIQ